MASSQHNHKLYARGRYSYLRYEYKHTECVTHYNSVNHKITLFWIELYSQLSDTEFYKWSQYNWKAVFLKLEASCNLYG